MASMSATTVKRIEASLSRSGGRQRLFGRLQTALEQAGVEFIPEDDHKGPGVRLKERARTKPKRGRRKAG